MQNFKFGAREILISVLASVWSVKVSIFLNLKVAPSYWGGGEHVCYNPGMYEGKTAPIASTAHSALIHSDDDEEYTIV
mgnify:CR=1 FL=1